MNQLHLYHNI